jgi:hypothetical protein
MRLLLCSWVLLLVTTVVGQDSRNIKTDKIEGVICTNFAAWKSIVPATEFWTPTKDDVLAAEPQIEAYLKRDSKNLRTPDLWHKLPGYKRQYIGIVVNGHRRIFCRFFCVFPTGPLNDQAFWVEDGGECFFRIEYDLDDQQCYNFKANAYA